MNSGLYIKQCKPSEKNNSFLYMRVTLTCVEHFKEHVTVVMMQPP